MSEDIKHNLFPRKRDKRWVLSYVPLGGSWKKPKQITAPADVTTERKARAWADEELAKIRAGGGVHPTKKRGAHTLREVHEKLMSVRAEHPDISKATLANNWTHLRAQILNRDINPAKAEIADVPMADVDVARARAFVRLVRSRASANHCWNVFSTARAMWDTADGERIIRTSNPFRNPLVIAELPERDEGDPIVIVLVVVMLLAAADDDVVPLERRVRYVLAVTSGLDEGEIAGLQWKHIVEAPVPHVQVRQALAIRGKDGFATVSKPKTKNRLRDVPLHRAAIAALAAWRAGWERLVRRKPRPDDFVFVWADGRPQRHKARAMLLRDDIKAVCGLVEKAGQPAPMTAEAIAQITFKACRRTFSSLLKNEGVDEEDRGRLMGHSGGTVTARNYTRHEIERLAGLVARIPLEWPFSVGRAVTGGGSTPLPHALPIPDATTGAEIPTSTAHDTPYPTDTDRLAKPSYVGSNPIRASVDVPATQCETWTGPGQVCGAKKSVATDVPTDNPEPPRPVAVPGLPDLGAELARVGINPRRSAVSATHGIGGGRVRVETPDGVVVSTDVEDGESPRAIAERLAFGLRQKGVDAGVIGSKLIGGGRS